MTLTTHLFLFLCSGLDNKITVYPLSLEDDSTQRKKPVGTHTSYTAYCTFLPNSDYQVRKVSRCTKTPLLLFMYAIWGLLSLVFDSFIIVGL